MDPDIMKSVLVKNFENFSDIFSEVSTQKQSLFTHLHNNKT